MTPYLVPIISLEDKTPNHLSWARMLGARLFNSGEHSQGIDQSLGVHRRERRWLPGSRHNNSDVICNNCPPQWTDFASIDRVGLAIALRAVPPQLRFARHRIMPSRFHDRTAGISPARLVAGRATRNDRHALGSDWRF